MDLKPSSVSGEISELFPPCYTYPPKCLCISIPKQVWDEISQIIKQIDN